MKKDNLTLDKDSGLKKDDFEIREDFYKGSVNINGYLSEQTLNTYLEKYNNWNIIEWRIPATLEGLNSQQIGLDAGFKVVGYDPGSIYDGLLIDSVLMCYFPNGIDFYQFEGLNLTEKSQLITNNVINSLKILETSI